MRWLSESEGDIPRSNDWLTPREAERAERMRYPKRRIDFLLGRWTAKRAVAHALERPVEARSLAGIEIRNARDGAPEAFVADAPAPLAISISDRAGWGVCAVGEPGFAIGCDLELVEPRSDAFVADYLTPEERARVEAAASEDERQLRANLLWCAKESALKVLRTGLRRDTRSVAVTLEDVESGGWHGFGVIDTEAGRRFPGWWRRYGAFVLTFAAEREMPPPASFVDPPGLASAEPTHAWLAESYRLVAP